MTITSRSWNGGKLVTRPRAYVDEFSRELQLLSSIMWKLTAILLMTVFCSCSVPGSFAQEKTPGDIRSLSQHFIDPKGDLSPWVFNPKENIEILSATRHPGLLMIDDRDTGEDIKGILKEPIRIEDYPLPW